MLKEKLDGYLCSQGLISSVLAGDDSNYESYLEAVCLICIIANSKLLVMEIFFTGNHVFNYELCMYVHDDIMFLLLYSQAG